MFKKLFFIVFVTLMSISTSFSQYNLDMGVGFGASGYLGEIGGKNNVSKGFVGDLLLKQTNITAGWFMRNKLTPKWAINSGLNYVRLAGDDANTPEGPRNWRNLRFKNDIFELTSKVEFTFLEIADLGRKGRYNTNLHLYAHTGFTLFYHTPMGSTNGSNWVKLRPLKTEGVSYKKIGFASPTGGGVIITHNRYTRFGLVLNYTKTFTDYLDDISTVYADPQTLSEQGRELANQYIGPENELPSFSPGERRGDPSDDDVYLTISLTYSRYLLGQNKYYRGGAGRARYYYKPKSFQRSKSRIIRSKF